MRRFLLVPMWALLALAFSIPAAAATGLQPGATVTGPLGLTCEYMHDSPDNLYYWLCGGMEGPTQTIGRDWGPNGPTVKTFDGIPLDVDVTLPANALLPSGRAARALPLMVMMHGWGGNKAEWESQTIDPVGRPEQDNYNNLSFVSRGYAVLTYSSRGMGGSCGPSVTSANPACANGYTHLGDRRFEIRDTQYLAGLLADDGYVEPTMVGVTGLSYGGGQSWELAMAASEVTEASSSGWKLVPWTSGPRHHYQMKIAVAVPHYGWSDLIDSLLPNGRATDGVGVPNGSRILPVGVEKESYVDVLFEGSGGLPVYYCPGDCPQSPSAALEAWFADISKGEPYSPSDPILKQADTQIRDFKSAYYLDDPALGGLIEADTHNTATQYEVPLLVIQGWTDALFPDVEAVSMINKLKHYDSSWPVGLAISDIGHPDAQNKPSDWAWLNARANAFVDHYMLGTTSGGGLQSETQVSNCAPTGGGPIYSATSFQALQTGSLKFSSNAQLHTVWATDSGAGIQDDPIAVYASNGQKGKCIVLAPNDTLPDTQGWTFPLTSAFTLLGSPQLHLNLNLTGSGNAEVDTRLWDVAPDGSRTLVSRGVYRLDGSAGPASLATELSGNSWQFVCGHSLELEVTQDDAPYLRPDNLPSAITYDSMSLTLPTHGQSGCGGVAAATATTSSSVPGMGATGAPIAGGDPRTWLAAAVLAGILFALTVPGRRLLRRP